MMPANTPALADAIWALIHRDVVVGQTGQSQYTYCMTGLWCTEYHGSGVQPTMTYVGSAQSTSPENMDMPLLSSTGIRKDYLRKMVHMNAAQVEEQAQ